MSGNVMFLDSPAVVERPVVNIVHKTRDNCAVAPPYNYNDNNYYLLLMSL